jgi:signal transduction histidine kinase
MTVELAEIAAGLPMVASFAVASGITSLREGRRRAALNEALHELRRPLQVLAFSLGTDTQQAEARESSLKMTTAALARLDHEINGGEPPGSAPRSIAVRPLLEAAVARWKTFAGFHGTTLSMRWCAADPLVRCEEFDLSQALDNLLNNAIEHGGSQVMIEVREVGNRLRLAVLDSGAPTATDRRGRERLRERVAGRCRHGHGLRVVARTAAKYGGSFRLRRLEHRTEARLELPLPAGRGGR